MEYSLSKNRRRYPVFSQESDKRMRFLREVIARKEQELQCKPQGTLMVNSCRGKTQYYLSENDKRIYQRESTTIDKGIVSEKPAYVKQFMTEQMKDAGSL